MRIAILVLLFCFQNALVWAGKLSPITVKEVSLMLRSGYSSQAVEREVGTRHCIDLIDPAAEKALRDAGAGPGLIESLRSSANALPAEEIAALQKESASREQRRLQQIEEAHKGDPVVRKELAQKSAAPKAVASTGFGPLPTLLRGNLVTSKNGILQTFNNQALDKKKLIALYFSARWCPECRKFTPQLVEYYNRIAAAHPELEIIFVSFDRSAPAMEAYMRDSQMPWPAVAFDNSADNESLRRYAGAGIPCLVLLDGNGQVISDSYDGKTYLGPGKVLADLDRLFGGAATKQVAQQP